MEDGTSDRMVMKSGVGVGDGGICIRFRGAGDENVLDEEVE